ncbi:hypothetical protein CHS0354_009433, partial [Potamilus streckersoni]
MCVKYSGHNDNSTETDYILRTAKTIERLPERHFQQPSIGVGTQQGVQVAMEYPPQPPKRKSKIKKSVKFKELGRQKLRIYY